MEEKELNASETKTDRFRRFNFFVNKKLQLHFAASSCCLILFSTISVWAVMNWIFNLGMVEGGETAKSISNLLFRGNSMVMVLILADTIAVFLLSIYFSHYVAGPIVQFERVLQEILETKQPKLIVLRKHDLLQETALLINEVVKANYKEKS